MSDEQIANDDEGSEGEAPIAIATSLEYSKWVNTGPSRLETIEGYRTAIAMAREEGAESELLRELMLKDLFFLLIYGLGGNTYANNDWVFDRCREFQESSTGYIDLWPRFHFKSTIITLAAAIQRILNDPEITIGIFSYNRPTAKVFLRAIKTQFESNEKLKELFPDILWGDPSKEAPKWSEDDGIVVKRNGFPREMTVEASGLVDSMPTGRHYKLRIYDDVVVPASVSSPEMIEKTTEAIELSFNLGTIDGEDEQWMVGTVYNRADTNQRLIARGAVKPRVYAATKDGTLDGEPWVMKPALLRKKIKEMGSYVASCQLFNKPVLEGEETFSPEWVQYWRPDRLDRLNLYMLIDPANSKTKKSDYTVIIIMGLGPDRNYYLVDGIRDKLSIRERTARVMAMHAQYRPLIVGYEKYGIQTDIEFLEEMQAKEQYRFRVEPLGGSMSKEDRIRRLQPLFESRRVYLPEKLIRVNYQGRQYDFTQVFLQNEYLQFPYMVHDDMLDCMARITDEALKAHFPQGTMLKPGATMLEEQTDEAYAFDTYSY